MEEDKEYEKIRKWTGGKEGFGIGIGDLDRAVKGKGGEKANGTSRRQRGGGAGQKGSRAG